MAEPLLYETDESAHLLRLSEKSIRKLMGSGELPSVKIGRRRLVRRTDLEEFVEHLGAAPGSPSGRRGVNGTSTAAAAEAEGVEVTTSPAPKTRLRQAPPTNPQEAA